MKPVSLQKATLTVLLLLDLDVQQPLFIYKCNFLHTSFFFVCNIVLQKVRPIHGVYTWKIMVLVDTHTFASIKPSRRESLHDPYKFTLCMDCTIPNNWKFATHSNFFFLLSTAVVLSVVEVESATRKIEHTLYKNII